MRFHNHTGMLQEPSIPLVLPPCRPRMREAGNSRSGRWTDKEEKFARYIIHCYATGLLQLDHGVTLRTYLAKKLRCLPSRITKKFKGNDDSNIQGAQRSQKDSSTVSPRNVQLAQQNLQTLEKEFLQELTSESRTTTTDVIHTPAHQHQHAAANFAYGSWQPQDMPTNAATAACQSPQRTSGEAASRDQLLNMSLGLNSILGSLLQRACTENHAMIQQQQSSDTMNAWVGALAAGQQSLSVPVTPTSCPSSPAVTPPIPNFSSLVLSPTSPALPLTPTTPAAATDHGTMYQYGATPPRRMDRTGRVLHNSLAPRATILPRPSGQPVQLRPSTGHLPVLAATTTTPKRNKKKSAKTTTTPQDEQTRQPQDMEDADAFLSFVQSVNMNNRSPDEHNDSITN